jgi:hypothetical protein
MTEQEMLRVIAQQGTGLNDWERRFVKDMEKRVLFRRSFTENQSAAIKKIYLQKTEDGQTDAPDGARRPDREPDEGSYDLRPRRPSRIRDMFDQRKED